MMTAYAARRRQYGADSSALAPDRFPPDSKGDSAADAARQANCRAVLQTASQQFEHNRNRSDKTGIQPVSDGKTFDIVESVHQVHISIVFSPFRRWFHQAPDTAYSVSGKTIPQLRGFYARNRWKCHNDHIDTLRQQMFCFPVRLTDDPSRTASFHSTADFFSDSNAKPVISASVFPHIEYHIRG